MSAQLDSLLTAKPQADPGADPVEMQQQIDEARAALTKAERLLSGIGREVSVLAARSAMNEAAEWLEQS